MGQMRSWTVSEAAFVLGQPLEAFKKFVDKSPVRPSLDRRSGVPVRSFGKADLVFFYAARQLKEDLTPKARKALYEALVERMRPVFVERMRPEHDPVALGALSVSVAEYVAEVERRLGEYESLAVEIEVVPKTEPRIRGTSVSVYRIAALLDGGMTIEDVMRDYPSLGQRQLQAAKAYADAHPKPGRPYPKVTVKKALRGSGLDALIEDVSREG